MPFELLNPGGLERPVGYTHVAKVGTRWQYRLCRWSGAF
jgi:hypothetical protein